MRHNAAYQLAILGKQDKPCGSRPEMANLRIGSRVIIDRLPTNTDMNFGCLFSGCINGPEGNAGPVTPAFPFPTMRRHSLVAAGREHGGWAGTARHRARLSTRSLW